MRGDFRELWRRQLDRSVSAFEAGRHETRPPRGWLRAVREALGMTLADVGQNMKTSRRRIKEFEDAEAADRITLQSLRRVANAMDCELVYSIVPKSGTVTELADRRARARDTEAEERARAQAREDVLDVEHNMALENQASGDVDQLIEEETKRRLKK